MLKPDGAFMPLDAALLAPNSYQKAAITIAPRKLEYGIYRLK